MNYSEKQNIFVDKVFIDKNKVKITIVEKNFLSTFIYILFVLEFFPHRIGKFSINVKHTVNKYLKHTLSSSHSNCIQFHIPLHQVIRQIKIIPQEAHERLQEKRRLGIARANAKKDGEEEREAIARKRNLQFLK